MEFGRISHGWQSRPTDECLYPWGGSAIRGAIHRLVIAMSATGVWLLGAASPPPVHSPLEQQQTFRFAEPGYRIELVAAEPLVEDPVAMAFDGQGRLWVVEMRGFMRDLDRSRVMEPDGSVVVLEDLDGDGFMDRRTVFLDGLVLPRAISIQPDGVLIAENKPLWFVQDLDGDLKADRKTLVDPHYAKGGVEHSANGLLRGLDNWIYNAKEGHRYRRKGAEWIRDRTEKRGQWGICQDDWGRLFYNYNHSQLHADIVPPNTLARNPHHRPTTGLSVGVADSNRVFPVRQTLAANRAYIPGVLDERGRMKEFTSACSPLVYRGGLFPEFRNNAFVCEPVGNLIKRNILSEEGLMITGTSAYPDKEFLASTDERFRPCALTTGPDGAICLADLYRGVIQDGVYMSPQLREHSRKRRMDKPVHLGRIWRIVPEDFQQPSKPDFAAMTRRGLVRALSHKNGWRRDMAQLHLVERGLISAIPELRQMALKHADPIVRLHALWTLEGLRDSEPESLLGVLRDASPRLRAAGLRVLQSLDLPDAVWRDILSGMEPDELPDEVALQTLLTLGGLRLPSPVRLRSIHSVLMPKVMDPLMRDAAMSSLGGREGDFLRVVLNLAGEEPDPFQAFLIESLSSAIVVSGNEFRIRELMREYGEWAPWKREAIWNGVRIHGPALARRPVGLSSRPAIDAREGEAKRWFAWPGHTPEPPKETDVRPLTADEAEDFARGRQIYLSTCVACHGSDGRGLKMLAPPLAGSDWVQGGEQRLVRILLHGLSGPVSVNGRRYAPPEVQPSMPPLAMLNNSDTAAVLTYVRREWGNTADPVAVKTVSRLRIETQGRTIPWTETELKPFDIPFDAGR